MPAGELRDVLVVPGLNPEEGRHLRHAAADGGRVVAERFQSKRQLVPDLVRHHLVLRVLLDKADARGLGKLV